jgi:hypothetical protein
MARVYWSSHSLARGSIIMVTTACYYNMNALPFVQGPCTVGSLVHQHAMHSSPLGATHPFIGPSPIHDSTAPQHTQCHFCTMLGENARAWCFPPGSVSPLRVIGISLSGREMRPIGSFDESRSQSYLPVKRMKTQRSIGKQKFFIQEINDGIMSRN